MHRNRRYTLITLSVLFIVTLVTGTIGWSEVYTPSSVSGILDAVYHALLAFVGDRSYVKDADGNLWLETARFTGLLTTISAVISLAAVFSPTPGTPGRLSLLSPLSAAYCT